MCVWNEGEGEDVEGEGEDVEGEGVWMNVSAKKTQVRVCLAEGEGEKPLVGLGFHF